MDITKIIYQPNHIKGIPDIMDSVFVVPIKWLLNSMLYAQFNKHTKIDKSILSQNNRAFKSHDKKMQSN